MFKWFRNIFSLGAPDQFASVLFVSFSFQNVSFYGKRKKIKKTNGTIKRNKERNWGKFFLARNLATTCNLSDKFS